MRCFFIGHRDAGEMLMSQLETEVKRHILEYGVTEFVVGQYGAFDRMAARAVINAKKDSPNIRLSILLPYHPSERDVKAPKGYDDTFYPPDMEAVPKRFAIVRANQYVIKHSEYLIAYAWKTGSNAREFVEFARRQKNIVVTELPHFKGTRSQLEL